MGAAALPGHRRWQICPQHPAPGLGSLRAEGTWLCLGGLWVPLGGRIRPGCLGQEGSVPSPSFYPSVSQSPSHQQWDTSFPPSRGTPLILPWLFFPN